MTDLDIAWLHIISQSTYHAEAEIIGTKAGLEVILSAINHALADRDGTETVFANDGEGYRVKVRRASGPTSMGSPVYLDEIGRDIAKIEADFIRSNYKLMAKQNDEALDALMWCRANGNPHHTPASKTQAAEVGL